MVEIAATLFVIIVGLYIGAWVLFGACSMMEELIDGWQKPTWPPRIEWPPRYSPWEKELLLYVGVGFAMLLCAALLENIGLIP